MHECEIILHGTSMAVHNFPLIIVILFQLVIHASNHVNGRWLPNHCQENKIEGADSTCSNLLLLLLHLIVINRRPFI